MNRIIEQHIGKVVNGWNVSLTLTPAVSSLEEAEFRAQAFETLFYIGLNTFIAQYTGFKTLGDLAHAEGGYCPTMHVEDNPLFRILADVYDDYQKCRGDPRRAYRT